MSDDGVDYSFSRPSPQVIRSAGYSFVCRYLSEDNSDTHGKILFKPEADALKSAGLDIVSNYEFDQTNALNGYAQGVSDATVANQQATAAGMPAGRPIYFSVDFDATEAQQSAINSYLDGVASVIGRGRTGAYGGYYVIERLLDAGKIAYAWQTYAWSGGQWDSRAQLRQVQNDITVDGQSCDKDESVAADFGQWSHIAANAATSHVLLGDVTGDGKADLVAIDKDGKLYVYPNTGGTKTDTWAANYYAGFGWTFPHVMLGDVNGDGKADLVVIDKDGKLYLYPNAGGTGTDTWGAKDYAGFGWDFVHVMLGDVTGDGRADLVAIDKDGKLYVYPNQGKSGTDTWSEKYYAGFGWDFPTVMLADVTGDGRADLVAIDKDGKLYVYPNQGKSGTDTWGANYYAGYGWNFVGVNAGDVNGDRKADLVAVDGTGKLYVYLNAGGTRTDTWGPDYYAGFGWDRFTY